jgi:4'-phosphopantetheinyl transferase
MAGVRIWVLDLTRYGAGLREEEGRRPRLSLDELARAASFASREEGDRWLAVRIALRLLIEADAGPGIRGQPLAVARSGKPGLPHALAAALDFSVSHSGDRALIAIADGPVGVDLEHQRTVRVAAGRAAALEAAAAALAGSGAAACKGFPQGVNAGTLLRSWVRLEAYAKARGSGIGRLLEELALSGPSRGHSLPRAGELAAALRRQEGLSVGDLPLAPGLFGAVACREGERPVIRDFAEARLLGR